MTFEGSGARQVRPTAVGRGTHGVPDVRRIVESQFHVAFPHRIWVSGEVGAPFDADDGRMLEFTDPPLTTVRQPVQAMASAAVRALLADVSGEPAPRAEYVFRPELVVRGSTGPVRAERERGALALDGTGPVRA